MPLCWKCRGLGSYDVARFIPLVDDYRVVLKRCVCRGESGAVSPCNEGAKGATMDASVLKYCGSEIAPGAALTAPGTSRSLGIGKDAS